MHADMQTAIFDLDGVILDSMEIWNQAGRLYLQTFNIAAPADLGQTLFAMTMAEGAAYLKQHFDLAQSDEQIVAGIHQVIADYYAYEVALKPGVKTYLQLLQQQGVRRILLTGNDRMVFTPALQRLGILDLFDAIYTCSETGKNKYDPTLFLSVAHEMALSPSAVWVFEDALHALETAGQAGFVTVAVQDAFSRDRQQDLLRTSDHYIETFEQLTEEGSLL